MKKVLSLIWKYKVYILLVFLLMLGIIAIFYQSPKKEAVIKGPDLPSEGVSYKSIIPGVSNEEDVKKQLGDPINTKKEESKKILEFKSTSPVRTHEAIIEEGKNTFIKEIVSVKDKIKSQDLIQKYGEPTYKLYNQEDSSAPFYLYVYPDKGFAFIGHNDGTLLEIWYFPPTIISEFITKWASNYSFSQPPPSQDN